MSNTSFFFFLQKTLPDLDLLEVSELFPKSQINALFVKAIDDLLPRADEESRLELLEFSRMDLVGYIEGALRRSGFRDPDIDSLVHDLVVKLLVTGNLFSGWKNQSLIGRFKISVANAIKTLISKRARSRKRSSDLPDGIPASRPQDHDDVIREFRNWLRIRYGETAVKVFDHRLEGGDTADLIGLPGLETSYKVKQAVRDIKSGVAEYSTRDPDFFRTVQRAFESEKATINRRFPSRV